MGGILPSEIYSSCIQELRKLDFTKSPTMGWEPRTHYSQQILGPDTRKWNSEIERTIPNTRSEFHEIWNRWHYFENTHSDGSIATRLINITL